MNERAMVCGRAALLCALVIAAGCRRDATPATELTLEQLAAGWSGGRTDPVCGNRGPRGEYLGTTPGAEYCQWPMLVRGAEWGKVGGSSDALFGLSMLTWERLVADSAAVVRLADSLTSALTPHGLLTYPCRDGGRRWQRPGLGLELLMGPPDRPDGRRTLTVLATTIPSALSPLLCPNVPTLPPEMPKMRKMPAPRSTTM